MSSLKDIMDVDVEPLESQAYRRSKEAAQQQQQEEAPSSSHPPHHSSESPSPPPDDRKGKAPVKRRRSNRVSKSPGSHRPTSLRPSIARGPSSAAVEGMDYSGFRVGGSNQASTSGSPLQSSGGSDPTTEVPVKYTPVTGRVSRAKKGVPVHTCDICRPAKTFTRAEHLRRHQLSHQKPAYPCTFEDCERAFHRPDLLARHLNRHETQGEKAYKSGDPRSRASSSASESQTSSLKVETPARGNIAGASQGSPTDSITPRTSASGESSMTASTFSTITGSFQAVNFSPDSSHKRSASGAPLPDSESYPSSARTQFSRAPEDYAQETSSFSVRPVTDLTDQQNYVRSVHTGFENLYSDVASGTPFTHALPLLRIPEEPYMPSLSYTQENSPWCSSASDSNFSTQSEGSRNGPHWVTHRARSASVATVPDWSAQASATQWPHTMNTPTQDLRSPPFEAIMEQYEAPPYPSPRMSPPSSSRLLLDGPNSFGGYYVESVGTPALSAYSKPLAQFFSASPSRISDPGLAGTDRRSKNLVESQQLGTLTLGTAVTSCQSQFSPLDPYLCSYWDFFDPFLPIIHRRTFDPSSDVLLSSAMAAIGTQYKDCAQARQFGMELHEQCKKNIDLYPNWSVHTMQTILLTEIFSRFRGRKVTVRCSRQFEELYSRLIREPFSAPRPGMPMTANFLLDPLNIHQPEAQLFQRPDLHSEWGQWIKSEVRRRLIVACFIFDVHQAMYHEQSRSKAHLDPRSSLLCVPCPESLWNAHNALEWQSARPDYSAQPLHPLNQELSEQYVRSTTPFTQSLIICCLVAQLPIRGSPIRINDSLPSTISLQISNITNLFPISSLANSCLALYHTPLHDLLAIAGDTWVFGQKLTPPSAFHAAQSRLKTWSSSPAAGVATHYACQVLRSSLSDLHHSSSDTGGQCCSGPDISDYWSLYISALICWAFGHRHQSSASGGSRPLSRTNSSNTLPTDVNSVPRQSDEDARVKALAYTSSMLELSIEDFLTAKAIMRGETSSVIDVVRARLELDNVGGKSMALVDAVGVLKKIQEARGKWF